MDQAIDLAGTWPDDERDRLEIEEPAIWGSDLGEEGTGGDLFEKMKASITDVGEKGVVQALRVHGEQVVRNARQARAGDDALIRTAMGEEAETGRMSAAGRSMARAGRAKIGLRRRLAAPWRSTAQHRARMMAPGIALARDGVVEWERECARIQSLAAAMHGASEVEREEEALLREVVAELRDAQERFWALARAAGADAEADQWSTVAKEMDNRLALLCAEARMGQQGRVCLVLAKAVTRVLEEGADAVEEALEGPAPDPVAITAIAEDVDGAAQRLREECVEYERLRGIEADSRRERRTLAEDAAEAV